MKYLLAAWMRDKPGVLHRVSGLLRRRNFNIESLQVSHSETPGISRMTFVVDGDDRVLDQVMSQLIKLVDVTEVENLSSAPVVSRELALVRVAVTPALRTQVLQLAEIFRAQIVDVSTSSLLLQIVGNQEKIEALLELLYGFEILEMVRTGPVAMKREAPSEALETPAHLRARTQPNGAQP